MGIKTDQIDKSLKKAEEAYRAVILSQSVSSALRVDGLETRGEVQDNNRTTTVKEQNTKTLTCTLDIPVKRGSYVELQKNKSDKDYLLRGVVTTVPNENPVNVIFSVLLFNTQVKLLKYEKIYNSVGDVIDKKIITDSTIPCFVQKISKSERMLDSGIERDSINELTTLKKWEIRVNDILVIGDQKYIVNDLDEIEQDLCKCYMTFYRS